MAQVVIANRLRDGVVVFLGIEGRWLERVAECSAAHSTDDCEKILAEAEQAARNQEIVGPNLIDVEEKDGVLVPKKRRELIRSMGPTIRADLGKQAES